MQNLSIQLIINPQCQLVAIDNTSYLNLVTSEGDNIEDITDHVSLEFLVYSDETHPADKTVVFKEYNHRREEYNQNITTINFPKDGTYTYYKFIIPRLEHLVKSDSEQLTYNTIKMLDQTFYWDGHFYIGKKDLSVSGDNIGTIISDNIDTILSEEYSYQITNFLEIWESIQQGKSTQTFSYQKIIFSVCKLQNCLVNLQRKILDNPKNCLECDLNASIRYRRDFLLSSLYVFDYLKDRKNYDEAQRILDNLSSCTDICGEDLDFNNDCGCGSIKY